MTVCFWRALVWAAVVAALTQCSTPLSQLRSELGPRASAELNCPEGQHEYQELERLISTTRVKVSGCGRKAGYRLVESRWTPDRIEAPPNPLLAPR